jgi:hypothetical protein
MNSAGGLLQRGARPSVAEVGIPRKALDTLGWKLDYFIPEALLVSIADKSSPYKRMGHSQIVHSQRMSWSSDAVSSISDNCHEPVLEAKVP